jgi:pimeloyl-ACP methyl ester carboxylesterase
MAQEDDVGLFDWVHTLRGIRLIRYDARGHGGSKATYRPEDYQWPALAADMLGLADALGVERPFPEPPTPLARSIPNATLQVAEGLDDIRAWPELITEFLEHIG